MPANNKSAKQVNKKIDFPAWLQGQLDARGWGQSDLANEAKINRQVIWGWLNKGKKPNEEYLLKVAKALEVSPQEIYQAAGILPHQDQNDIITQTVINLMQDLDRESKNDIVEYVKFLRGKRKDN